MNNDCLFKITCPYEYFLTGSRKCKIKDISDEMS